MCATCRDRCRAECRDRHKDHQARYTDGQLVTDGPFGMDGHEPTPPEPRPKDRRGWWPRRR